MFFWVMSLVNGQKTELLIILVRFETYVNLRVQLWVVFSEILFNKSLLIYIALNPIRLTTKVQNWNSNFVKIGFF